MRRAREIAITIGTAVGTVVFAFVLIVGMAGGAWSQEAQNCDPWQGLVPVESSTNRTGCVMEVRLEGDQQRGFLWGLALGIVPLSALVIARLGR